MQTKIKICGIFREADTHYINSVLPDFAGFIINYPKSHRSITPQQAQMLRQLIDNKISTVGVFVNNDLEEVAELANSGAINIIQLHGNENDEYIYKLKQKTNAQIWKSYIIKCRIDVIKAEKSIADMILLDAGLGGGVPFDHDLIQNIGRDYILAGGLNSSNIVSILKTLTPYALDISSGVETNGIKDGNKISEIVDLIRNTYN